MINLLNRNSVKPVRFIIGFILLLSINQLKSQTIIVVCDLIKDVRTSPEKILQNPKQIVKSKEDKCVLKLIDSLYFLSKGKNGKLFLQCLDSICKYSDGYLSESLIDIGADLFNKNFKNTFDYIYNSKTFLEGYVINGLSMRVSMTTKKEEERKKIKIFSEKKANTYKFDSKKRNYLNKIIGKIDPKKYD